MRLLALLSCSFLCLLICSAAHATGIIVQGDVDFLKDIEKVNIVFEYDSMAIKNDTINLRKPHSFKIEKVARPEFSFSTTDWSECEERFIHSFNDYCVPFKIDNSKPEQYIMVVKVISLEPGFDLDNYDRNARLDADISWVDSSNPSLPLFKITVKGVLGIDNGKSNEDFKGRILSVYTSLGIDVGKNSRLNDRLSVRRRVSSNLYKKNLRQEKIDLYGKDYYKDRRLSKVFLTSGCVVGGLGVLTMFFGSIDIMGEPVHSNVSQTNMSSANADARRLMMIGGGMVVASIPLFYFSRKYDIKSTSQRVSFFIDQRMIQTPQFVYRQPTLGIKLNF